MSSFGTHQLKPRHGHSSADARTPTYRSWRAMTARCTHPSNAKFTNYGGRGIKVCERWKSFPNFLADMGERPAGTSIDRIDSNGNYEPGNCQWLDHSQNCAKSRANRLLTLDGKTQSVAAWARETGISRQAIYERLLTGWSVETALTKPMGKYKSRKAA
jgi:hypothetical protein